MNIQTIMTTMKTWKVVCVIVVHATSSLVHSTGTLSVTPLPGSWLQTLATLKAAGQYWPILKCGYGYHVTDAIIYKNVQELELRTPVASRGLL